MSIKTTGDFLILPKGFLLTEITKIGIEPSLRYDESDEIEMRLYFYRGDVKKYVIVYPSIKKSTLKYKANANHYDGLIDSLENYLIPELQKLNPECTFTAE